MSTHSLTIRERQQIKASAEALFNYSAYTSVTIKPNGTVSIFVDIPVEESEFTNKLAKRMYGQEFDFSPSAYVGDTQEVTRFSGMLTA
jgi:hypothetical protein